MNTIGAMAKTTEESDRLREEFLKEIQTDGIKAEMYDEPIARLRVSLLDEDSIKQARYLERTRALTYLVEKRNNAEGKPESIKEIRHVRELTDEQLEKRLQEAAKPAHSEPEPKPDKILH